MVNVNEFDDEFDVFKIQTRFFSIKINKVCQPSNKTI